MAMIKYREKYFTTVFKESLNYGSNFEGNHHADFALLQNEFETPRVNEPRNNNLTYRMDFFFFFFNYLWYHLFAGNL